jgi:hypothetical protein
MSAAFSTLRFSVEVNNNGRFPTLISLTSLNIFGGIRER